MKENFLFVKKNFWQYRWHIFVLGILGFLSSVLGGLGVGAIIPLLSILIGQTPSANDKVTQLIAQVISYIPFANNLYSLLAIIVGLFLLRSLVLLVFGFIKARVLYDYKVKTVLGLFDLLLSARWSFFLTQKVGYMQNIFFRDVDKSADILDAIAYLPFAVINVLVYFVIAFLISPQITLFTMLGGIIIFISFRPLLKKQKAVNMILSVQNKVVSQFLVEHIIGMKSVKSAAIPNILQEKSKHTFTTWRGIEFKSVLISFLNRNFFEPMSVIFVAAAVGFSYNTPGFRLEAFAATILLIQRIFVYMQHVQIVFHGLVDSIPYAVQAYAFRDALEDSREETRGKSSFAFGCEISFKDVVFAYNADTPVLSSANFSIKKGETVGLIGPSGSGKTSIADLLLRLFQPDSGKILLDDKEAEAFDLADWRKNFGYVSQDIFLLNDTIAQNIRFYNGNITDADMAEAAKKANIYEFIQGLKDGFQTIVGDRGIMLSGGQRQRIVLARTLARKPTILLLDEATSALDNESEILIQKAIHNLRGSVTVFIIAHRLSTVMDVDRLLVLDKGKIMEEGKPLALLENKDSYFYKMFHLKEGRS